MLNQDETPLLYSLVFGEGVVNDATSVVLFNAIQRFDLTHINSAIALEFAGNFFYLFILSTALGVAVSFFSLSAPQIPGINRKNFSLVFFQAGLLSAFVIKKLYIGRYMRVFIDS